MFDFHALMNLPSKYVLGISSEYSDEYKFKTFAAITWVKKYIFQQFIYLKSDFTFIHQSSLNLENKK